MTEHFNFFFVKPVGNGSLFVGPKLSNFKDDEEKEDLIYAAHEALVDAAIDVSKVLKDEDYGELRFYINNRLNDAIEILHEIDDNY